MGVSGTVSSGRRRYAIVGVGGRSGYYHQSIDKKHGDTSVLVGFCDNNLGRLRIAQQSALERTGVELPIYDVAADPLAFDKMVAETRPDEIIVTSRDCTHDHYIVRAMELGCDVTTEKPMTTDETKCQAIIDTQRKTGRSVRVTFNYRYSPPRTQVKDLLMKGTIGEVLSVDFHWMLDTHHGADYFRRWHSNKVNSGGLMVHKATHHFDLINWWLSDVPVSVFASGKREFYIPQTAKRLGLTTSGRCLGCPSAERCAFRLDLTSGRLKSFYLDCEPYDGYVRDMCVFRPEIDIEDTVNTIVTYSNRTTLSYSLNAFAAWEGYHVVFNGTKGRLEHKEEESAYINGDGTVPGAIKSDGTYIRVYPLRAPAYEVEIWRGEGGHGGGDPVLLRDIFAADKPADPYMRRADQRSGAWSILVGVAANKSMATGMPIRIQDLVQNIGLPDYPKMPSRKTRLPMPGS